MEIPLMTPKHYQPAWNLDFDGDDFVFVIPQRVINIYHIPCLEGVSIKDENIIDVD